MSNERVHLLNGYFMDLKRSDGQVSATLLYLPSERSPLCKLRCVELVASSRDELDEKVAAWADRHASNLEALEALGAKEAA